MNTFLPYPSFTKSLACLDNKRLNKQRLEAWQILAEIEGRSHTNWRNHPATKMWVGHSSALRKYYNIALEEWISRGFKNTMQPLNPTSSIIMPEWFGMHRFHDAHKSNLLRKDPIFYGKYNWDVPNDLKYVWPV